MEIGDKHGMIFATVGSVRMSYNEYHKCFCGRNLMAGCLLSSSCQWNPINLASKFGCLLCGQVICSAVPVLLLRKQWIVSAQRFRLLHCLNTWRTNRQWFWIYLSLGELFIITFNKPFTWCNFCEKIIIQKHCRCLFGKIKCTEVFADPVTITGSSIDSTSSFFMKVFAIPVTVTGSRILSTSSYFMKSTGTV